MINLEDCRYLKCNEYSSLIRAQPEAYLALSWVGISATLGLGQPSPEPPSLFLKPSPNNAIFYIRLVVEIQGKPRQSGFIVCDMEWVGQIAGNFQLSGDMISIHCTC